MSRQHRRAQAKGNPPQGGPYPLAITNGATWIFTNDKVNGLIYLADVLDVHDPSEPETPWSFSVLLLDPVVGTPVDPGLQQKVTQAVIPCFQWFDLMVDAGFLDRYTPPEWQAKIPSPFAIALSHNPGITRVYRPGGQLTRDVWIIEAWNARLGTLDGLWSTWPKSSFPFEAAINIGNPPMPIEKPE